MTLPSLRRFAALPVAAMLLAGCGGTDTGGSAAGGPDPASVMPKDSVLYLEAVVRPEGDQEEQVRAFLSKVLRTEDPGAKLEGLVDKGLAEEGRGQTYEQDIEPWLGERVAVTVTDLAAAEPGYIVAASTDDTDAAAEFVAAQAKRDGSRERSHKDAEFFVDEDGTAAGVVGDFLVVAATEAGFKRAVDTVEAEGLDSLPRFEDALEGLPEERLGTFYVDTQRFGDAAAASTGDETAAGVVRSALKGVGAVTAFAQATEDTATIESRIVVKDGPGADLAALGSGAAPELLESLPGDAWAAFAVGDLGQAVRTGLEAVAGGVGTAVLNSQLKEQTGLDLQQDVLSWIGDVALFVRGDTVSELSGGLVVKAADAAAAERALPRLAAAAARAAGLEVRKVDLGGADDAYAAEVPGAPGPLVLARAGDRVVLALGADAAEQALDPSGTLGDSPLFGRAEEALDGVAPSFVVDGPTAVKLIAEAAAGDPDFAQARPYLEVLDLFAAGSAKDGGTIRQRFAAKVR